MPVGLGHSEIFSLRDLSFGEFDQRTSDLKMQQFFILHLLYFMILSTSLPYLILARPYHEEIDKTQELVGKIVDLIKREQIRMNLIEEDQTEILNESSVRKEIENMIEENRLVNVQRKYIFLISLLIIYYFMSILVISILFSS